MRNDRDPNRSGRCWSIQEGCWGVPRTERHPRVPRGRRRDDGSTRGIRPGLKPRPGDLAPDFTDVANYFGFLISLKFTSIVLALRPQGERPLIRQLTDDQSRARRVGWKPAPPVGLTPPLGRFAPVLCSCALRPSEPLEGLLMAEAAGRVRGQMWLPPKARAQQGLAAAFLGKDSSPGAH